MQYRVFDEETRQFNNVPIQPVPTLPGSAQEEETDDPPDDQIHEEMQDSNILNEQPAEVEVAAEEAPEQESEKVVEVVIDDQGPPEGLLFALQ